METPNVIECPCKVPLEALTSEGQTQVCQSGHRLMELFPRLHNTVQTDRLLPDECGSGDKRR